MLHNGFPERDHTQIHVMVRVTNTVPQMLWQPSISADVPEEDVRVEQESHSPSNAFKMSSGNGASKPSGTVNSPAHNPKGRTVLACEMIGLTSATGFPAWTMTNVSPASTRCR